jgi:hypothetical protein
MKGIINSEIITRQKRQFSLATILTAISVAVVGGVGVIAVFQEFATSVEQMDGRLEHRGI